MAPVRTILLAVLFGLAVCPATRATTLYNDGSATGTSGHTFGGGFQIADTFTLASDSVVTGVLFPLNIRSFDGTPPTVLTVTWSILSSIGSGTNATMDTTLASGTAAASNDITVISSDSTSDLVTITLPSVSLPEGDYWLKETGVTYSSTDGSGTWLATSGSGSSGYWNSIRGYDSGLDPTDSFQILGTVADTDVPEPATLMIVAPAALLLALRRHQ